MHYVVELALPSEVESAVMSVWRELATRGLASRMLDGGGRPHVSLIGAKPFSLDEVHGELEAMARDSQPFEIALSHLGIFPGDLAVLFAGVTRTASLAELQRRCFAIISPRAEVFPYYYPDQTVFHCSLGLGISKVDLPLALELAGAISLPSIFVAESFEIVEYGASPRRLARFDLG